MNLYFPLSHDSYYPRSVAIKSSIAIRGAVPACFRVPRALLLALSEANLPWEPASGRIEGIRPREPPPLSLHLHYRNHCAIISRALISAPQGGYMVNATRASTTRATTPRSPRRAKISHRHLVSVRPAISNRHKLQLESSVTSRKQTTAPNSNRHQFCPNSAPTLRAPAVTTQNSPLTIPKSATDSSHPLFPNFLIATQILDLDLRRVAGMRACEACIAPTALPICCNVSQAFRPGLTYAAPPALVWSVG